ncbi:MAG TPA: ATP-binding cassette domain-containing protein, partial [Polyangia bacterium]
MPPPVETARPPAGELIVRLDDVGKMFRRFEQKPFLLREIMKRLTMRTERPRDFWPLRHISFDIHRGETVGVVGQNGSGKSTLLRLIAGAAYPTEGHIAVRGRIAPLLALGAGFQPDMTGRECVQINATA